MKLNINPFGVIAFGLVSAFAVTRNWSLPEFCWSTWLAGLVYTWACAFSAALQIILTAGSRRAAYEQRFPALQRIPPGVYLLGMTVIGVSAGVLAFRIYGYMFAFYGVFLSNLAEMEPHALFGSSGFINSDFFTPLMFLADKYWAMAAGVLLSTWEDFVREDPWRRVVLPIRKEMVRMHIMIVALPFISLLAWALFRGAYQSITIVSLMGLFYLLPTMLPAPQPCRPT